MPLAYPPKALLCAPQTGFRNCSSTKPSGTIPAPQHPPHSASLILGQGSPGSDLYCHCSSWGLLPCVLQNAESRAWHSVNGDCHLGCNRPGLCPGVSFPHGQCSLKGSCGHSFCPWSVLWRQPQCLPHGGWEDRYSAVSWGQQVPGCPMSLFLGTHLRVWGPDLGWRK